jgi:putative Mg2+ transporter-C (MgtC) family protein
MLRPLVNLINRIPIDDRSAEATYEVSLLTTDAAMPEARDLLVERLEAAKYPVGDVKITERGNGSVEILATLVSTAINPKEVDAVILEMEALDGVLHATWEGSNKD